MSRQPHGSCPHCGLTEWEPVSLGRATIWRCENCGVELSAAANDATYARRNGVIAAYVQIFIAIAVATFCIWGIIDCY